MQHPLNNAYAAEAQACEALQAALREAARCEEALQGASDAVARHETVAAPQLARLQQQVGAARPLRPRSVQCLSPLNQNAVMW